jgi:hypothetical protein
MDEYEVRKRIGDLNYARDKLNPTHGRHSRSYEYRNHRGFQKQRDRYDYHVRRNQVRSLLASGQLNGRESINYIKRNPYGGR